MTDRRPRQELCRVEDTARSIRNTHPDQTVTDLADLIARLAQVIREDIA